MNIEKEPAKNLKIAVVHDHLGWCGGGERTVLIMALELGADFITAYAHPNTFPEYQKKLGDKLIVLSKKVIKLRVVRFFWLRGLFWRHRNIFKKYDVIIASTPTATEMVAKFANNKTSKIVYTHTTPRRIFDKYEFSKKSYPVYLRPLFAIFVRLWRKMYLNAIIKYNFNISNSLAVKKRVEEHTKTEVNAVVWPPILTDNFKWINQGDYYLSWARIDELKRVELIVKAFRDMPDKKLIIASGGPRLEKVKSMAENFPNIKVLGWVSDQQLIELVGNCRAAIYIPIDEDAGMTHLEANAAGKPVLAVAEGGLIESTINNKTGILLKTDPGKEDLIKAINYMTAEWCLERKEICINHAQKYSKDEFIKKIKQIIKNNNPELPVIGIDASRWEDPRRPGESIRTGVETYSVGVIKNLIKLIGNDYRLRLYTPKTIKELPLEIQKVIPGSKRWTQKKLTRELKYSPIDYFFTPAYYIPKTAPKKSFVTIHDVEFKIHSEKYSFIDKLKQNFITSVNIKRADKILTVSEYSKNQIMKAYKITGNKIMVVPIGYDRWIGGRNEKRLNTLLFVGRLDKKKSLHLIVKAFANFKHSHPDWNLILAGKPGFGYNDLIDLISESGLKDSVNLPGYVDDQEKRNLFSSCGIFIQPSSSEGSCIPLFEAWDAEIPAIIADSPVFKEIGGDGALFFKAGDHNDLANQIDRLASDKVLQAELISRGNKKLNELSWRKTADQILNIILK